MKINSRVGLALSLILLSAGTVSAQSKPDASAQDILLSTGVVFTNPKALRKAQKKLTRLQRQLQHKVKGSSRRNRQKLRIAKTHRRVSNLRKDATHKATTYICKNHAVVGIEDLNASGMMANHKLAGAVADSNFYEFSRQIEYKATRYGSQVVLVDPPAVLPHHSTCPVQTVGFHFFWVNLGNLGKKGRFDCQ